MVFLFCGRWSFCAYAVIVCLKFSFRSSKSHTNKQTNKYKHVHLLSRALLLSIFNCWSIVVYAFDYTVAWLLYFASDLALVVFGFVAIDADVGFFFLFHFRSFPFFLFFSLFLPIPLCVVGTFGFFSFPFIMYVWWSDRGAHNYFHYLFFLLLFLLLATKQ